MTILRYVLLLYGFIGIFVAGGLFFSRASRGSTYLSFFVGLLAIEMFEFLYSTSQLAALYPEFFLINFFVSGILYGPILFFHFKSIFELKIKKWELLHLLPAILMVIHLWELWMLPGLERIAYTQQYFLDRIMPLNYIRAFHQLVYGVWLVILIKRNYPTMPHQKRLYAIAIATIYLTATVFVSWLTEFAESWRGDFIYYYFIAFTLVLIIGYLLYSDPRFLHQLSKKYLTSSMPESEMKAIQVQLEDLMKYQKVYLKRDLNLRKVSDMLGKTGHQVSQTLSELKNEGFNDYINKFRVIQAKSMLGDMAFDHYKIEAIALESGFNNKVTFNKAFKKHLNQTPTEFRKSLALNKISQPL